MAGRGCFGDLQPRRFFSGGRTFQNSDSLAGRPLKEGEKMSRATYPLKLPISVKKAAERLAKRDGVSLNQWIAVAVAEKVGVTETDAEFFKMRSGNATGKGLMRFLRYAPDSSPGPEDNLR
jgi:hypothetical protein